MKQKKNIAIVAHDNRKKDIMEWVSFNWHELVHHDLICTGTTGKLVEETLIEKCREIAEVTGARITITDNVEKGVKGCDFLYTDVWVSMGEPAEVWQERINLLQPYQVNSDVVRKTENQKVKILHRLPAFNNREKLELLGASKIGIDLKHAVEFSSFGCAPHQP